MIYQHKENSAEMFNCYTVTTLRYRPCTELTTDNTQGQDSRLFLFLFFAFRGLKFLSLQQDITGGYLQVKLNYPLVVPHLSVFGAFYLEPTSGRT